MAQKIIKRALSKIVPDPLGLSSQSLRKSWGMRLYEATGHDLLLVLWAGPPVDGGHADLFADERRPNGGVHAGNGLDASPLTTIKVAAEAGQFRGGGEMKKKERGRRNPDYPLSVELVVLRCVAFVRLTTFCH